MNQSNVLEYLATFIDEKAEPEHVEALLTAEMKDTVRSVCIILIATGAGVVMVSLIGFCGAIARNQHFMLGVTMIKCKLPRLDPSLL